MGIPAIMQKTLSGTSIIGIQEDSMTVACRSDMSKCNNCPDLKTIKIYEWEICKQFLKGNLAMRTNIEWRKNISSDTGPKESELDMYFDTCEKDLEVLDNMTLKEKRKLRGNNIFEVLAERR